MKLLPASRAAWMIRIDSSWSGLPHAPNIIAPRQKLLIWTPVRPRGRSSIVMLRDREDVRRRGVQCAGDAVDDGRQTRTSRLRQSPLSALEIDKRPGIVNYVRVQPVVGTEAPANGHARAFAVQ